MYRSIYYDERKEKIHLWGDGEHNDVGYTVHDYEPYAYMIDRDGDSITIDGYRCKKVKDWSDDSIKMGLVYEHNVSPATRFLIDRYADSDEVSKDTKILYIDIEVAKEEKYSTPEDADNTVTAITYFATGDPHYTCLLLDTHRDAQEYMTTIDINGASVTAKIKTYKNERDVLMSFMNAYQKVGHNIITGWNVEFFDMPYLYNRIVKIFGYDVANSLSPDAKLVKKKFTNSGELISIAGVTVLDYLNLYKKFTYIEQSNYRLNTIAKFELGRGKVEYEGDLDHLYNTDIVKFAEYNIVDVELVVALENKLELIMTALGLCHKGHCAHQDIQFTSAYLDGAALTYCRRNGLIASANKSQREDQAQGAFVKQPTPGLYKWVYDLDLTSLYPMNMITLNISPETKYCKIHGWDEEEYVKGTERTYRLEFYRDNTVTGEFDDFFKVKKTTETEIVGSAALKQYLIDNNLSVASNGVTYTLEKDGVIPAILKVWFDDRKRFKDLRKEAERDGDMKLAAYYDRKQLITKILLNSFYGVLLLPSFRFYDKANGEAVTLTGQSVIQWATRAADFFYNKELGTTDKSYCIYTDTDSIFEPLEPLFVHRHGVMESYTDDEIVAKSKDIINDVQTFVNGSYSAYAKRYHNVDTHRWDIKQELIAKRAFWVGAISTKTKQFEGVKKRYAQWIVDKEGHRVDHMDVKGLDVVRSSFPEKFRSFMDEILRDILHDADKESMNEKVRKFKSKLNSVEIHELMLPTGVKDVEKWHTGIFGKRQKGTPVHVKAAMNYNDLLDLDKNYTIPHIQDGEKILWGYLKQNKYNFDTMALKGFEDPKNIRDFVHAHIDRDAIFESVLKTKLTNFWLSLGWGEIVLNDLSNKFFKF
jgi:DNA polymerase elongation subunit (family B)